MQHHPHRSRSARNRGHAFPKRRSRFGEIIGHDAAKSAYKPKITDPRVRRKITAALDWALPKLNLDEPFQCHRKTLTKLFGNQTSNELGKLLRAKLLSEQNASYKPKTATTEGFCKTYRISESGFNRVCALLYGQTEVKDSESKARKFSIVYAQEKYKAELSGAKPFQYEEKSYRLYHELQGFRRELKHQIFDGWRDYDISTAMPTIFWNLHQTVQHERWVNPVVLASMSELLSLEQYINDKVGCRSMIATKVGIDTDTTKRLINGLFLGMRLTPHHTCAAFKLLGFDPKKFKQFASEPFILGLVRDIRKFWFLTARRINSQRRLAGQTPIKKSLLYFYYEKIVLDVVRSYLDGKGLVSFLEHDGFRVKDAVDLNELCLVVKDKTGFDLVWEEVF